MSSLIKNKQILVNSTFDINNNRLANVTDPLFNQDAATKKYVDNNALIGLYSFTGITSNSSLGTLISGLTLGIMYIENLGTVTSYVNLGTTATGDEINPYGLVEILSGETLSITVNRRLSNLISYTLYVSSASWTDVNLTIEWSEITYKNQLNGTIVQYGTPLNNQVAVWAGDGSLQGSSNLTLDGSNLGITGTTNMIGNLNMTGNEIVTGNITATGQILAPNIVAETLIIAYAIAL